MAPMSLRICLIAAEIAPFSKTGGLADVCGALTKYLQAEGHDVRVFTPLYALIDRSKLEHDAVEGLQNLPLEVGPHSYLYSVRIARVPGTRAHVYFIDCPALY